MQSARPTLKTIFDFMHWSDKVEGEPPYPKAQKIEFEYRFTVRAFSHALKVLGNLKEDVPGWRRVLFYYVDAAGHEHLDVVRIRKEKEASGGT